MQSLEPKDIHTVNGEILHGDGVSTITLTVDNISPIKADILVVDSLLLSLDMLNGIDIIKILG